MYSDTLQDSPQSPGVANTASRLFTSMRKTFSHHSFNTPRKKQCEDPRGGMYSTPEERYSHHPSRSPRTRYPENPSSRPTVEQIAMGLHISRTPHLRPISSPLQRYSAPSTPSRRTMKPVPNTSSRSHSHVPHGSSSSSAQHHTRHNLPPGPSRSSMKKTSPSSSTLGPPQQPFVLFGASPSTSTVNSGGPATPDSPRSILSLKLRMSKLIPGYRPSSSTSSTRAISFTSSASDDTRPVTPRKAVRFSTSVLALDERSS
ncbi:hypothetical protein F5I97DRAFT_81123 [Phlebopus sp. FC_14]|nr:hypothetical protein F5I97DRAFT_81123 [Phlebopus sp. FC_14]